jgi:hypothetical protein
MRDCARRRHLAVFAGRAPASAFSPHDSLRHQFMLSLVAGAGAARFAAVASCDLGDVPMAATDGMAGEYIDCGSDRVRDNFRTARL